MSNFKPYILIVVIMLIIGAIYFINSSSVKRGGAGEVITVTPRTTFSPESKNNISGNFLSLQKKSKKYKLAKEITTPDGFINTNGDPISISDLIGKKVILVDFWTYSCINCLRTTPYLNSWYEKYKDDGFVIIGLHTPEFEFEKDYDNVKRAVEKNGIKFPVVLDNDYSTWNAYKNRYWPRKYLIDIDGYIVYDHIGEGRYEETEKKIQEALVERMAVLAEEGTIDKSVTKEITVGTGPRSPEIYFGAWRNQYFKSGLAGVIGNQKDLSVPNKLRLNSLYFSGDWDIADKFAQNSSANARIVYRYTAKDVFFVAESDNEIVVEVLLDGQPLGAEAGADVIKTNDEKTVVKIKEARLYKIIESNQSETHTLEFIIQNQGLQAYTFTFG